MGEKENQEAIERYFQAVSEEHSDAVDELFHEDAIQEWPQSGERIRGMRNIKAIDKVHPVFPKVTLRNIRASGDLVVGEVELDYDGKVYNAVSIFEFDGGRIRKQTDYFSEPFQAPAWRARWVEKI